MSREGGSCEHHDQRRGSLDLCGEGGFWRAAGYLLMHSVVSVHPLRKSMRDQEKEGEIEEERVLERGHEAVNRTEPSLILAAGYWAGLNSFKVLPE